MTNGTITVTTGAQRELVNITARIEEILARQNPHASGLLCLFTPHTTAGLTINEVADPDVARDIIKGLELLVPLHLKYRHLEGNSPAHIMAMLAGSSLTVPFVEARMQLGTWQGIFFCEFDGPRTRNLIWRLHLDPLPAATPSSVTAP
jgi:secondary thiamine-phosphate synthase enzyme